MLLWALTTFTVGLANGCATAPIARLPTPISGETDVPLLAAHESLERAFAHCSSEYTAESLPFPLLLAGASGASTVALLAASGAMAFALPEPYNAAGAVGAGVVAVVLGGVTVFFAGDVLPFYGRAEVREAALQKARYDAQKALRTRDPSEVDRVTRQLYENCRIANVTPNQDAASSIFRDLERYRRESDSQRRWVKVLEGERALEREELERLRVLEASTTVASKRAPASDAASLPPDPVATVGAIAISRAQFDAQLRLVHERFERGEQKQETASEHELREIALRHLVDNVVVSFHARALGVSVAPDAIENALLDKIDFYGSKADFAAYLERTGQTEDDVRKQLAQDLLTKRVFELLHSDVPTTAADIRAAFDLNRDAFVPPARATASHIVFNVATGADEATWREKEEEAKRVLALAQRRGADFAELARLYSEGPTASAGGHLGTFGRGKLVPPLENAAFGAPVGVVTGPIRSQFGIHLVLVHARLPASRATFNDVKEAVKASIFAHRAEFQNATPTALRRALPIRVLDPAFSREAIVTGLR